MGGENAQYSALVRETMRKGYRFDRELALRQHAEMVDAYRQAGVYVHLLHAHDELPILGLRARLELHDAVRRGRHAARQSAAARRVRQPPCASSSSTTSPIYDLVSAGNFEGGDYSQIVPGCVLIGYTGLRGEGDRGAPGGRLDGGRGIEVVYAPIDEYYVHIDLMVCMVAEKLAAVCLDTTDPAIVAGFGGKDIEVLPVSFRETYGRWAATS